MYTQNCLVACDGSNDLVRRVEAHICSRLIGRVKDLRVLLCEGGLILQGLTRTYYAKQLGQQAVCEATTLPIFANEIQVS
jgi:hypothetical protein